MDQQRWREVRALFDELVELPPGERERRLAEVAQQNPALADAVARLIEADTSADQRLARMEEALLPDLPPGPVPLDPIGLSGRMVSHFRVLELIGAGGMGAVYRAEDTRLGRIVAIKLPLPAQLLDASGRSRFLREARAAAALDHPNICHVHEVGESDDGRLFLAMPHYGGETLKERLSREGALPEALAVDFARQIAAGLTAAHAAGIVHRDLKPGNVMLLPDGSLRILDFGLAKMSGASVTATGDRLGTASYMAPEQIRGGAVDARADLWALGVILYEMLTGRRPFGGDTDLAVAHAILHDSPAPPTRWASVSPAVSELVLRLLVRDPALRVASAAAVSAALSPEILAAQGGPRQALARGASRVMRAVRTRPRTALAALALVLAAVPVTLLAPDVLARAGVVRDGSAFPAGAGTEDPVARNFYLRGREYETRGLSQTDVRYADALYRQAIARDSGFALARARHAITRMRLLETNTPDELEQAIAPARAALARAPALGDAHLALGHYWSIRGQPDSALDAFRKARAAMPESGEVALGIAGLHLSAERWDGAVAELERARQLAPRDLATARLLSFTYSRLRRYEEAAATWELVTSLIPDDYQSQLIKGYMHVRWRGSADTLAAVLSRIPAEWDQGGMKTYAGVAAARVGRTPAAALPILDSARVEVSEDGYTYRPVPLLRAQVYDDLGDSVSARAWYARTRDFVGDVLAERPGDPRVHIALGWAHAGLGHRDSAVAAAHRAMELAHQQSDLFGAMPIMGSAAEVFARAGAAGEAVALLDSLLALPAGREASVMLLRADPNWDPIRSDSRFEELLARRSR